jgi:hypothetical protein
MRWLAKPRTGVQFPLPAPFSDNHVFMWKGLSMRKREKKEKRCLNCGSLIPNRNVYCNNKCQGEYSTKITFTKIENGDTSFSTDTYKKYLINKFGNKCMKCGWNEINPTTGLVPIQLEHKDGNSENNNLDNLELLCPNHHSLTPTYGALNKGNGRTKRQEKRKKNNNYLN